MKSMPKDLFRMKNGTVVMLDRFEKLQKKVELMEMIPDSDVLTLFAISCCNKQKFVDKIIALSIDEIQNLQRCISEIANLRNENFQLENLTEIGKKATAERIYEILQKTMPKKGDSVTEVLEKILYFIVSRHKILKDNIAKFYHEGFVPLDLPVDEFATIIEYAIEHKRNNLFLLYNTNNIEFRPDGTVLAVPVVDRDAQKSLKSNIDEFLEEQFKKLEESSSDQKFTETQLLKLKQKQSVNISQEFLSYLT
jgi:hypothetical protein